MRGKKQDKTPKTKESIPAETCKGLQVHGGKLHDGRRFAMKIQYPGVARSIESDVDNLMRLINIANLLPKGLYVEQAADVSLLSNECFHKQISPFSLGSS